MCTPLSEICSNVASDWLCEFDPNQPPPPQDPNCPPGTSCDPNQPPPDQPKIPDIPPENRDIDPCFGKGKGTCFSAPPQQPPQQPLPSDSPPPLNKEAGECTVPLGVGCNIIQKGGNNSPSPTIGGDIGSPSNTDVVNPGGGGIPGGGLPGGSGQVLLLVDRVLLLVDRVLLLVDRVLLLVDRVLLLVDRVLLLVDRVLLLVDRVLLLVDRVLLLVDRVTTSSGQGTVDNRRIPTRCC